MLSNRKFIIIILWLLGTLGLFTPAKAFAEENSEFTLSVSQQELRPGDTVVLSVSYSGKEPNIGAFLLRLEYDSSVFTYQKIKNGAPLQGQYYKTEPQENYISTVFTNKNPSEPTNLEGQLLEYSFSVNALAGNEKTSFTLAVEQLVNNNGVSLGNDSSITFETQILEPLSNDCRILNLWPAAGTLTPAFHPDTLSYQLEVPFSIAEMTFDVETVPQAAWKINRKNLGAGGSATNFTISVTSEDKSQSRSYSVVVNRQNKDTGEKKTSAQKKTAVKNSTTAKNTAPKSSVRANSQNTQKNQKQTDSLEPYEDALVDYMPEDISASAGIRSNSSVPLLIMEDNHYTPFLFGAFGGVVLILILYVLSLQLKLLILQKEEKLSKKENSAIDKEHTEAKDSISNPKSDSEKDFITDKNEEICLPVSEESDKNLK